MERSYNGCRTVVERLWNGRVRPCLADWLLMEEEFVANQERIKPHTERAEEDRSKAGAYTRPLLSSPYAVLVTLPRVPLSNRLGENHAPNVSNKICLPGGAFRGCLGGFQGNWRMCIVLFVSETAQVEPKGGRV